MDTQDSRAVLSKLCLQPFYYSLRLNSISINSNADCLHTAGGSGTWGGFLPHLSCGLWWSERFRLRDCLITSIHEMGLRGGTIAATPTVGWLEGKRSHMLQKRCEYNLILCARVHLEADQ